MDIHPAPFLKQPNISDYSGATEITCNKSPESEIGRLISEPKMKIVFITDQPVPNGMASTNRLLSLATGIRENGCKVDILVLNPTEKKENLINTESTGDYKGVGFMYLSGSTLLPSGISRKFFPFLKGLINLLPELKRINRESKIDAVIMLHTYSIYPLLVYCFFSKLNNIILLQERNEYSFLSKDRNVFKSFDYFIYTNLALKCFDGLLVITNNLKTYYKQFLNKHAYIKVIPMTVEPERFCTTKKDPEHKYIAYCGHLGGNKDGVYHLIEAFSIISKNFPDYYLYVIGDTKNKNDLISLKAIAKKNNVGDKVIFTGKVSRDEIPPLLDKAEILALARPQSIQAEGGFPTKLGEYLATGNPVVVTRVGEIPDYLSDGINAYLANPDDVSDFAENLTLAITNKEQSMLIGKKGQELAYTIFNNKVQGKNIIGFIKQIISERRNQSDIPG
jgi:glycosyltransferase involved in cell wall biosynthesis